MKKTLLLVVIISLFWAGSEVGAEDIQVAVAIPPLETFVEEVGGEEVKSVVMIPPGRSPANYAPSPRELAAFSDSVIYFSLGLPAEEANILPEAREINSDLEIVRLEEQVAEVYDPLYLVDRGSDSAGSSIEKEHSTGEESGKQEEGHEHSGGEDPHTWLSPRRAELMVEIIASELGKIDKENRDKYLDNAKKYIEEIRETDMKIRGMLKELEGSKFIIFHPSFGYFADEYGLEMVALEDEGKEASPGHLQDIIDLVREENIKTVFYQQEIDSRQTEALAGEVGADIEKLTPLASDYLDNLLRTAELLQEASGVDSDGND